MIFELFTMGTSPLITTLSIFALLLALVIAFTLHEFAHAFVAVKEGDPTPKQEGRLTLDPTKHLDPMGTILLLFVGFGFAKPVPINPYNFKRGRLSYFLVSTAGVITNIIQAFLAYPLYAVFSYLFFKQADSSFGYYALFFLSSLFLFLFAFNLTLFVFNLLPIHPMDGFKVVESMSKTDNKYLQFMRRYGQLVLMSLLILGIVGIDILGFLLNFATGIIGAPISLLWNFILGLFGIQPYPIF